MKKKGIFIALEGPDGSGKSTAAKLIKEKLEKLGERVVITREPGGTAISEKIRELLLDKNNKEMSDRTEALLYAAARAQHVDEKIRPLLEDGVTVITDRFYYSSLAYQGYARGLGVDEVMELSDFAINGLYPDRVLFFDIDSKVALSRKFEQGEDNRMEEQGESFHDKVYKGYLYSLEKFNRNVSFINANADLESVTNQVWNEVKRELAFKKVEEFKTYEHFKEVGCEGKSIIKYLSENGVKVKLLGESDKINALLKEKQDIEIESKHYEALKDVYILEMSIANKSKVILIKDNPAHSEEDLFFSNLTHDEIMTALKN